MLACVNDNTKSSICSFRRLTSLLARASFVSTLDRTASPDRTKNIHTEMSTTGPRWPGIRLFPDDIDTSDEDDIALSRDSRLQNLWIGELDD